MVDVYFFLSSLLFVSWTNYIFLFLSFSESHTVPLSWYHTQAHFFSLFPQCVLLFYAHIVSLSFSKSSIFLLYPFLSLSFFLFLCLSLTFSLFLCLSLSVSRSLTHRFYALWQICIRDAVQVFQLHDKRVSLAYSGGKNSFLYFLTLSQQTNPFCLFHWRPL